MWVCVREHGDQRFELRRVWERLLESAERRGDLQRRQLRDQLQQRLHGLRRGLRQPGLEPVQLRRVRDDLRGEPGLLERRLRDFLRHGTDTVLRSVHRHLGGSEQLRRLRK